MNVADRFRELMTEIQQAFPEDEENDLSRPTLDELELTLEDWGIHEGDRKKRSVMLTVHLREGTYDYEEEAALARPKLVEMGIDILEVEKFHDVDYLSE